jgi:hypothetical protein
VSEGASAKTNSKRRTAQLIVMFKRSNNTDLYNQNYSLGQRKRGIETELAVEKAAFFISFYKLKT